MKYIIFIFTFLLCFDLIAKNNNLYSFKNVHIEYEDDDSLKAKSIIIDETINKKFFNLLSNLTVNKEDINVIVNDYKGDDYLKNIVVKNEIVTEKKYIADIDIFFDKNKIIDLYKNNNILFSDTLSPGFLILSTYNFDGSNILWEKNNWNQLWYEFTDINDQLNIILPNSENINKVLLSSYDINNFNTINIEKILNNYNLYNSIIINASKEYNTKNGKIYINLLATLYEKSNKNLTNIYSKKIPLENLNEDNLLKDLTNITYQNIFRWWKNETITYFNQKNSFACTLITQDINFIQDIKNLLSSISQVEKITLKSLNYKNVDLNITYFGNFNELIEIFDLYELKIEKKSDKCILSYGAI